MKAKTALHLLGGNIVKVQEPYERVTVIVAQAHRTGAGSAFELTRVTDHGTAKRTAIIVGTILRAEEL